MFATDRMNREVFFRPARRDYADQDLSKATFLPSAATAPTLQNPGQAHRPFESTNNFPSAAFSEDTFNAMPPNESAWRARNKMMVQNCFRQRTQRKWKTESKENLVGPREAVSPSSGIITSHSAVSFDELKRAWTLACLVKAQCAQALSAHEQHNPEVRLAMIAQDTAGASYPLALGAGKPAERPFVQTQMTTDTLIGRTFLHGGIMYCVHKIGQIDGLAMGWYHDVSKFPSYPSAEYSTDTDVEGIEEALVVELQRRCRLSASTLEARSNGQCVTKKRTRSEQQALNTLTSVQRKVLRIEKRRRRPKHAKKPSPFRGVSWHNSKWKAQISIGGLMHFLGYFFDETFAARAYDLAAKTYRGNKARLNFSEEGATDTNPFEGPGSEKENAIELLEGRVAAIGGRLSQWQRQKKSSSFRGVSWQGLKWKAQISIHSQMCFLGYFKKEEDAAKAYDEAARMCRGANAVYNFTPNGKPTAKPAVTVERSTDRGVLSASALASVSRLKFSRQKRAQAALPMMTLGSVLHPARAIAVVDRQTTIQNTPVVPIVKGCRVVTAMMPIKGERIVGGSAEMEAAMLMATNFKAGQVCKVKMP